MNCSHMHPESTPAHANIVGVVLGPLENAGSAHVSFAAWDEYILHWQSLHFGLLLNSTEASKSPTWSLFLRRCFSTWCIFAMSSPWLDVFFSSSGGGSTVDPTTLCMHKSHSKPAPPTSRSIQTRDHACHPQLAQMCPHNRLLHHFTLVARMGHAQNLTSVYCRKIVSR